MAPKCKRFWWLKASWLMHALFRNRLQEMFRCSFPSKQPPRRRRPFHTVCTLPYYHVLCSSLSVCLLSNSPSFHTRTFV